MCGNDISTVVVPDDGFLAQIRQQMATGRVIIKNSGKAPKQTISINQINMFKRFDTSKLVEIQLQKCEITYEILQQFLKCDFSNLKILSLNHNKIGHIGCRILAQCQTLTGLKTLELSNNKIKDAGIKAITSAKFSSLQDLNLNDNNITIEGVRSLKAFPMIEYLSLAGNNLNDECTGPIQQINKRGFSFLGLSRNTFTIQSLRTFLTSPTLEILLFDRNRIKIAKKDLNVPKTLFLFY